MSPEFWAIIGVGVALVTLGWLAFNSLHTDIGKLNNRMGGVEQRLSALEATVTLIVRGLRIEIQGGSQ